MFLFRPEKIIMRPGELPLLWLTGKPDSVLSQGIDIFASFTNPSSCHQRASPGPLANHVIEVSVLKTGGASRRPCDSEPN